MIPKKVLLVAAVVAAD